MFDEPRINFLAGIIKHRIAPPHYVIGIGTPWKQGVFIDLAAPILDADPTQPERPHYAAAITNDLLIGGGRLRSAFLRTPVRYTVRDARLIRLGEPEPPVILIRRGFALRHCGLSNGRRAILHIAIPGDVVGLDHLVLDRPNEEIVAADRVGYHTLQPAELRDLAIRDPSINLQITALLAEMRWRSDRLTAIGRLEAESRIGVMLFDIYDRLHRRGLTTGASFRLPLTQQQMADHLGLTLVYLNRTLRRLREKRVVLTDRGTVVISDLDRLREFARGLPEPAELAPISDQEPFSVLPPL